MQSCFLSFITSQSCLLLNQNIFVLFFSYSFLCCSREVGKSRLLCRPTQGFIGVGLYVLAGAMSCVAIVDITHIGSTAASFVDLVAVE